MLNESELKLGQMGANDGNLTLAERVSTITVAVKGNPEDRLRIATEAFRVDENDPELVTAFQQVFWQVPRGERGYTFQVSGCEWTREEMERPMVGVERVEGRLVKKFYQGMMVAVPEEFQGKAGLILAGKTWPQLNSRQVREDPQVRYAYGAPLGYLKVEKDPVAPNRDTTQSDLEKLVTVTKRGQRLITDIVASIQSNIVAGEYFDLRTVSRLLGTFVAGEGVGAYFYKSGSVSESVGAGLWFLKAQRQLHSLGGRFEESRV